MPYHIPRSERHQIERRKRMDVLKKFLLSLSSSSTSSGDEDEDRAAAAAAAAVANGGNNWWALVLESGWSLVFGLVVQKDSYVRDALAAVTWACLPGMSLAAFLSRAREKKDFLAAINVHLSEVLVLPTAHYIAPVNCTFYRKIFLFEAYSKCS